MTSKDLAVDVFRWSSAVRAMSLLQTSLLN